MKKPLTLCLIQKDSKILLGMKKRGFGEGRWNGFGGKLEESETIEQAAKREVLEESGVEIKDIEKIGVLNFEFKDNPEILEVHIFKSTSFSGEPVEGEEMKPQWFNDNEIPFESMWPDDIHWFPLFLSGKKFKGRFLFGEGDTIIEKELNEVKEI
jgi:8-oxo-dGTP diphosphatase/2-hydroxy-dATP diphosphatase